MMDERKRVAAVIGCGRRSALYWADEQVTVGRYDFLFGWQFKRLPAASVKWGDWLATSSTRLARVRCVRMFSVDSNIGRAGARIARVVTRLAGGTPAGKEVSLKAVVDKT